ncbi:MAG TPA: PilZ domain-containing protein [Croceibacterium sp.]|nr:PilZ domain-containing protein [Croceibacterium sp.]
MERRAKFRSLTNVVVRCRVPASPDRAYIQDISIGGCQIATENFSLERGATILLDLTGTFQAVGRVVWTKGATAGIKFESKVSQAIVETFSEEAAGRATTISRFRKSEDGLMSIAE